MHPALSVILFTVASGAGYGLLAVSSVLSADGSVVADRGLGIAAFALAFGATIGGLISSTFHLGHPERAWRAFSQWRSSWLSREAILTLVTLAPGLWVAWLWVVEARAGGWLAFVTASLAVLTIASTAMIYASLKPVPAWRNVWTVPGYLALGLLSGALWAGLLCALFEVEVVRVVALAAAIAAIAAGATKLCYWRSIDRAPAPDTGAATGLGHLGEVRPFLAPHIEANYIMREMGHAIARKHARKLRSVALWAGLIVPGILAILAGYLAGSIAATAAFGAAVFLNALGTLVERWLFFAEAKHVVVAYYGERAV